MHFGSLSVTADRPDRDLDALSRGLDGDQRTLRGSHPGTVNGLGDVQLPLSDSRVALRVTGRGKREAAECDEDQQNAERHAGGRPAGSHGASFRTHVLENTDYSVNPNTARRAPKSRDVRIRGRLPEGQPVQAIGGSWMPDSVTR